ncbi:MAG TPA: glycosyltransferase [Gaiellaceae bacterium]|nr:glycosyltransferase [Gaiellaceae bacterium]
MRFVLANRLMNFAGGTEVHLVTVGAELLRLGHEVVIYSPELGPFADHARQRGIDVVDQVRELPVECDVVLAQDGIVVYELAERYPRALSVFRICGDSFDFQSPPQVEGIVDLVVVLSERYARLARACAVQVPLARLRIPVDIHRLAPAGAIRARPRHAVILGNYPDRIQVVRDAWERRGIEVSQVGGTQQRFDIAAALENADIVVGKSRAALDAMACGRAVYLYDMFGGDGWVRPDTYAAMEADHFAGQATGRVIGIEEMERDLADYDPGMGATNRDLVIQHHSARDHVTELLAALVAPPRERPSAPLRELARLTALQWSWERFAGEGQHAQASLHDRLVLAEQAAAASAAAATAESARVEVLEGVAGEAASLRADLETLHATRAWRLVGRYWRLRDRLRRR